MIVSIIHSYRSTLYIINQLFNKLKESMSLQTKFYLPLSPFIIMSLSLSLSLVYCLVHCKIIQNNNEDKTLVCSW